MKLEWKRADYNSTPLTTVYKFAHWKQLKRSFMTASSCCDLFLILKMQQYRYNFGTREIGTEWALTLWS